MGGKLLAAEPWGLVRDMGLQKAAVIMWPVLLTATVLKNCNKQDKNTNLGNHAPELSPLHGRALEGGRPSQDPVTSLLKTSLHREEESSKP